MKTFPQFPVRKKQPNITLVTIGAILFWVAMVLLSGCSGESVYIFVSEGEVKDVQYLQGNWSYRSKTIITFENGSTSVLYGHWSIPAGKIIVESFNDGNGIEYKIEPVYE